jgi:hypothetical protein
MKLHDAVDQSLRERRSLKTVVTLVPFSLVLPESQDEIPVRGIDL